MKFFFLDCPNDPRKVAEALEQLPFITKAYVAVFGAFKLVAEGTTTSREDLIYVLLPQINKIPGLNDPEIVVVNE